VTADTVGITVRSVNTNPSALLDSPLGYRDGFAFLRAYEQCEREPPVEIPFRSRTADKKISVDTAPDRRCHNIGNSSSIVMDNITKQ